MARSSAWQGHSPFTAAMAGSGPAWGLGTAGCGQAVPAPVFGTGTAGSNPAVPAAVGYSSGSRGRSAKPLIASSNPALTSNGAFVRQAQGASLSRRKFRVRAPQAPPPRDAAERWAPAADAGIRRLGSSPARRRVRAEAAPAPETGGDRFCRGAAGIDCKSAAKAINCRPKGRADVYEQVPRRRLPALQAE